MKNTKIMSHNSNAPSINLNMSLNGFSLSNDKREDDIEGVETNETKNIPAKVKFVRPSAPLPLISNSNDVVAEQKATKSYVSNKRDEKDSLQDIAVMIRDIETEKDKMMLISVQNAVLLDELAMSGADCV
uniref:Uncharacterized protein n=1 Tax=Leptocylindrus danicus TaxID=163516 RepID=A0A7S2PLX5_9STRA